MDDNESDQPPAGGTINQGNSRESSTSSSLQEMTDLQSDPQPLCKSSWVELRRKIFPIEIGFFGFVFSALYFQQLCQQYYFQRLAKDKLDSLSNYSSHSICIDQDYYVNYTSNSSFLHLQQTVNDLNMYSNITYLVISALITIFLGSLSDVVGRKPVILYGVIGVLCVSLIQLAIVHWKLNIYYYLIVFAVYGTSGSFFLMLGLAAAVITDVTPKRWLTIRMGFLEASISIARIISSFATNNWIQSNHCQFLYPALLIVVMSSVTLIYALLIPESLRKESTNNNDIGKRLCKIFNGFKLFFNPKHLGIRTWLSVFVALAITGIQASDLTGFYEIIPYYLHNRPLEWSYDRIGIFGAITASSMGAALLVILPVLVLLKLSDPIICLIGVLSAVGTNVVIATVHISWVMYVVGVVKGLIIIAFPAIRSILTELVSPEERGAVLAMSSAFHTFASIIATVIVNETYKPEITVSGHHTNAGIAFWIMAGICSLSIPLVLLLIFSTKRKCIFKSSNRNEATTGLLDDESEVLD